MDNNVITVVAIVVLLADGAQAPKYIGNTHQICVYNKKLVLKRCLKKTNKQSN
jgi:hypothetical protein